jgi:uncharacterized protein (TIGR03086 family)
MTATRTDDSRAEDLQSDPRQALARTQAWVAGLLDGIRRDQLALPTPCAEFDVAQLVGHLYGVAERVEAMGHGRPASSVPAFVDALPDDLALGYRRRAERSQAAWADDATLSRVVVAPFGPLPGTEVLGVYVSEQLTHGWDLAVATGQPAEAAAELVALGERSIRAVLDPIPRGGPVPFGPAVAPAPGAGPTEQLAAYLGRSWPRQR